MSEQDTPVSPEYLKEAAPLMYEALKALFAAGIPISQRKINRSDEQEWARLEAIWAAQRAIEKAETGRIPFTTS